MQNSFIYDVNEQNVQSILQQSTSTPILFYFWSERTHDHQIFTASLERIANEYQGKFILAKLNCDEQAMLASQFGLREIPTIYVFQNGQPVDGAQGNVSEEEVKALLNKVLPNEDELKLLDAQKLIQEEQYAQALPLLNQAWSNLKDHFGKSRSDIALLLAKTQIELKQIDDAKSTLSTIPLQDQNSTYHGLNVEIELLEKAANSPEIQQLQNDLEKDPNNIELMIQLSSQLIHVGKSEEALELLFKPLSKDLNAGDGQVKKALLDLLAVLGTGNAVAASYRRKLYSLLY